MPDESTLSAAPINVRAGTATINWPGGTPFSDDKVVAHGISGVPKVVLQLVMTLGNFYAWILSTDATNFTIRAKTIDGTSPGVGSLNVNWIAAL